MREIITKRKEIVYQIKVDGRVHEIPVHDYSKRPELSFMLMREVNLMQGIKKLIGEEDREETLDFEVLFNKAIIKYIDEPDKNKAQKILDSVTRSLKTHVLNMIKYLVDYDTSIFEECSYEEIANIFHDINSLSQGVQEEQTEDDKKKALSNSTKTTTNSGKRATRKKRSKNGTYTKG